MESATGGLPGPEAPTISPSLQIGFPLSECFPVLIILSLSQGQNCLFSTQRKPIRENLAGSFGHHKPCLSEGPCLGYRSELKLCRGVGRKGEGQLQSLSLTTWPRIKLGDSCARGNPRGRTWCQRQCSSLDSYEFKFMNQERTNK